MDQPVLQLRSVTKVYPGRVIAVRDVNLAVARGERTCLLGPNGAGKTTVVRLLEGALQPTSGTVLLNGVPSSDARYATARRQVGIVPQAPGMYDDLLLREYLDLVRRLYQRGDVLGTAEQFGLLPYFGRRLAALSGGLQRRAVLAAALLPEPPVLILDEPTVGLDPVAARDVRQVLDHAMAGRTVLLCTHNLAEAEALCEKVIILREGQVALHERIDDLRGQLAARVRLSATQGPAALAAALADLRQEPVLPPAAAAATDRAPEGVEITLARPETAVPPLLRALLQRGLDVYEVSVLRPTLEDLFFDVLENGRAVGSVTAAGLPQGVAAATAAAAGSETRR